MAELIRYWQIGLRPLINKKVCRLWFLLTLCVWGITIPAIGYSASLLQPSDSHYYIYKGSEFSFIFSQNFLDNNSFFYLNNRLHYYNDIYKSVFYSRLKEIPIYAFASPNNQTNNGITSSIPFLRVVFFPTGEEEMYRLATISWADTLLAHEMVHVYQLGQLSEHLSYLRSLFKNTEFLWVPPIFLNGNLIMPPFFLEGHAVLSESLFATGGRLYSGYTRAFVFFQLKHEFVNTQHFINYYLMNVTNKVFTILEKYNHGGYFFSTLMEKYDIKTINSLFKRHADYFVAPFAFALFAVKSAFEQTFNTSFESLVHYYIQRYRPLALEQKQSPEKVLFQSRICPPFNRQDNQVFFLTGDLRSTPVLRTFNRVTGEWTKQSKIFSFGKIFKHQKQYFVSSSFDIGPTQKVYGLFSEGMYPYHKKYQSQNIQDFYKDQWLSIDTSNNMQGFRLLLNGKFYDMTHSPALFGPDGSIYYFKQIGDQRTMYRNKTPIFQFRGFYGKPIAISKGDIIYFTAASLRGSSLFAWHQDLGIYRVSSSDLIVEAIPTAQGDHFLVCEIGRDTYNYKIIPHEHAPQIPAFYEYPFKTVSNSMRNTASSAPPSPPLSTSQVATPISDIAYYRYNSLREIQFTGIEASVFYDPITQYNLVAGINFKDPLEYNKFNLSYQYSRDTWGIRSRYFNHRHRLGWGVQYNYRQGLESFFDARAFSYIHELSQNLVFPLLRRGYWLTALLFTGAISSLDVKELKDTSYVFSLRPALQIQYNRTYSQNFIPHRDFYFKLSNQYLSSLFLKNSNFLWSVKSSYTMHLGWDFYTTPLISYRTAINPQSISFRHFKTLRRLNALQFIDQPKLDIFLEQKQLVETDQYLFTGVLLQKVLSSPVYFARIPLSLMRTVPGLQVKYIQYMDNKKLLPVDLLEWTLGTKLELLLHHKVKFNLGIYYGMSYPLSYSQWILDTEEDPSFFRLRLVSHF